MTITAGNAAQAAALENNSTGVEAALVAALENESAGGETAAQVATSEDAPNSLEDALEALIDNKSDGQETKTPVVVVENTVEEKDESPAKPKPKPRCGTCEEEEGKYKCPRCQFPYCSVACFRTHKENHPSDPPKAAPDPAAASQIRADQVKSRKRKHPFSVLDDSPELDRLFKKYPYLPSRLAKIHTATLPPSDAQQSSGLGGLPWTLSQAPGYQSRGPKWSHDTGLKRGKKALRKARTDPSEMGDAVREYCELVLYLLAKEKADIEINDLLRQQVKQEDVKMIEHLIAAEDKEKWN